MKRRLLTGKELRAAALAGLPVRYVEKYENPQDRHMNFNEVCTLEPAKSGFYIGNSDIQPADFADDQAVEGEFPEGHFAVYAAPKIKYATL